MNFNRASSLSNVDEAYSSKASDSNIHQLLQAMRDSGALQSSIDLGWKYVHKAEKLVTQLTTDTHTQLIMLDAVQYMMERVQ